MSAGGVETTADEKDILRRLQSILQGCIEEHEESDGYEQSEASTSSEEDYTRVLPDSERRKMLQEETDEMVHLMLSFAREEATARTARALRQQR